MNTTKENILDVTLLEPRMKHPTIFDRFDQLVEGESLTILNDHDPKPLYYQLLNERGNIFKWEYTEEGPEHWEVQISKRQPSDMEKTLGQIAAKDLRKAQVFKKYGLDFCCGGKKTVKQACDEKGIDATKVENELRQSDQLATSARPLAFDEWNLDFLVDYIVQVHHSYVKKNLPDIRAYAKKVMRVHNSRHPELNLVHELVEAIGTELDEHLFKEEQILFPYIKSLATSGSWQKQTVASFGTVRHPVLMMEKEHEMVGKFFEELRKITNNYTLPPDACATYSLLYRQLAEFEEDLHTHIHLENNILFPKAIKLEQAV